MKGEGRTRMELWGITVETKRNLKTLAKAKETQVTKMLEPVIEDYIHRHRHVLEMGKH
tara:strand:- start:1064 stop:1237 length:174 start_codon:yes stop_codon:yes gene_type:complete